MHIDVLTISYSLYRVFVRTYCTVRHRRYRKNTIKQVNLVDITNEPTGTCKGACCWLPLAPWICSKVCAPVDTGPASQL